MAREMNQADWRRDRNVRDEFGRLWLVAFEVGPGGQGGSNMPTGQICPAGWEDPLGTPQEYLAIPKGEFGEPDRNRLIVVPGLKRWLDAKRAQELEWRQRFTKVGQRTYKDAFNPKTHADDEVLLDLAGPRPTPPSAAIYAALQGDKGYLGLVALTKEQRKVLGKETMEDLGYATEATLAEPNPALPPTAEVKKPMPYFSFVAEMKKAGVNESKDIKAHWDVYRAEFAAKE